MQVTKSKKKSCREFNFLQDVVFYKLYFIFIENKNYLKNFVISKHDFYTFVFIYYSNNIFFSYIKIH